VEKKGIYMYFTLIDKIQYVSTFHSCPNKSPHKVSLAEVCEGQLAGRMAGLFGVTSVWLSTKKWDSSILPKTSRQWAFRPIFFRGEVPVSFREGNHLNCRGDPSYLPP